MLSRIAESLFWIGRYVERAEDTARILDVQTQLILEDPGVDEETTCRSLLSIMGVEVDPEVVRESGADEAGQADVARLRGQGERDHLVRLGHGCVSFCEGVDQVVNRRLNVTVVPWVVSNLRLSLSAVMIVTVTSTGFASGSRIRTRIRSGPAPSTFAASTSS